MNRQTVVMVVALVMLVFLMVVGTMIFLPKAHSAPFLVCDPQAGVTSYKFTGDAYFTVKAAEANGSLRYDLATIPVGTHNIQTVACKTDPLWGEACSTATPFTFPRPDLSTNAPSNQRLAP